MKNDVLNNTLTVVFANLHLCNCDLTVTLKRGR